MTNDEIMFQIKALVDAYVELNDEEGDGEADTWDFIMATYLSVVEVNPGEEGGQRVIDEQVGRPPTCEWCGFGDDPELGDVDPALKMHPGCHRSSESGALATGRRS